MVKKECNFRARVYKVQAFGTTQPLPDGKNEDNPKNQDLVRRPANPSYQHPCRIKNVGNEIARKCLLILGMPFRIWSDKMRLRVISSRNEIPNL
ncbi:MAG: hypothetical protein PHY05_10305, partial [Methanothrix sp.]|nr:hypothetical protein [Methanothrix sp.]